MNQTYPEAQRINELIGAADNIVIIQADNPDTDSLGSALALEQILSDMGKTVEMYCAVNIPSYLRYISGWDRVQIDFPKNFELSIIVDTGASNLLEFLNKSDAIDWVKHKPVIVIDHHPVESTINFATIVCNYPVCATGEAIYEIAQQLNWPVNLTAKNMIVSAIMSDSLGLTTESTSSRSIEIISKLVAGGVKIADLESKRRDSLRKKPEVVHYKGQLLQRVEYYADDRIAIVTIPWPEIETYSHDYNPSMLVLDDMRLTINTDIAIALKDYPAKRVTGKIKCNYGKGIANQLAQLFGGGGHEYASGFKVTDGRSVDQIKQECIEKATMLLDNISTDDHETL
ncbi:MAG TPA: DHH family phosphoesterase [Patescibacteria group bacterium]|jgi:phosphoesterase RecJ-like protein|nr:DHH family phosphoesterase [Patescibacteria group bacterium]